MMSSIVFLCALHREIERNFFELYKFKTYAKLIYSIYIRGENFRGITSDKKYLQFSYIS